MLERLLGTVDKKTSPSTLAPSRMRFAFAVATAMVLPGHAEHVHRPDASPLVDATSSAPNLSRIPPNTDLLGKTFRITENGPEACLCIEDEQLILRLDGERFLVQKICTIDGVMLDLTPTCVATCRTVATLKADRGGAIGRMTIPFMQALEQRMDPNQMLALAEQIRREQPLSHNDHSLSVHWKDPYGNPQGTATLQRIFQVPSLASR